MRWRNRVFTCVTFAAAGTAIWCTTGCTAGAGDGQAFVEDFIRQVIAAYLF